MGVCDVPGISYVCEKVGEGAAALVSAPFDWLASAMGGAAGWLFEKVWALFDSTTMVDLTNPGYQKVYALLFGVASVVMLGFFCLQLITALVRHEPGALARAATGLGKSVLGSFLVLTVTGLLLGAVDQVCVGIVQATGDTMDTMGSRIAVLAVGLTAINITAPGVGAIVTIFLAGLAISAALVVWFSLLVRKALLLVAVVFGPFALAGASWDTTRGWFGKWASFVVAMAVSKLVLVVVLLVGVSLAASPLEPDLQSVSEPVTGVVLMLIAAFAPYMCYKLIAFMGADMYQVMSAEQEAKQALNRPLPIRAPAANPARILDTDGGGGGGGSTPPPPSATPAPTTGAPASPDGGGGSAAASSGAGSAGAGAAAGAGPAAAVVVGAQVVKSAATGGAAMGGAVGGAASASTDAATSPSQTVFIPATPKSPPPEPPSAPTLRA